MVKEENKNNRQLKVLKMKELIKLFKSTVEVLGTVQQNNVVITDKLVRSHKKDIKQI